MRWSRRNQRSFALLSMLAGGALIVYLGFDSWSVNGIPAQYLGFFFAGFGALGLFGVNVWSRGPLDPCLDSDPLMEAGQATPGPDNGNLPEVSEPWWTSLVTFRIAFPAACLVYIGVWSLL